MLIDAAFTTGVVWLLYQLDEFLGRNYKEEYYDDENNIIEVDDITNKKKDLLLD
jgi:hypothetical protein